MVMIPAQFNGPESSGNGGYVCGMLAAELGAVGPTTSTLRSPPPLDVSLSWEPDGSELRLLTAGGAVVGSAVAGSFAREPPACPSVEQARTSRSRYRGFAHHPFDHCFTCGTQRGEGEGLRLFTGPVEGDATTTAGDWTPHAAFGGVGGAIDVPVTWAALDCPGGWAADFSQHTMVLGRMTAEVLRRPVAGEPCIATGRLHAQESRKFFTDTALYTADGEPLGRAEQVWIEIDIAQFG